MVAGMMIMICLNELIPTAHRYDPADKYVTKSILAGMMVMAASLCLFARAARVWSVRFFWLVAKIRHALGEGLRAFTRTGGWVLLAKNQTPK